MDALLTGPVIALAALLTSGLECPIFIRGDSNQDGKVDIDDPIRTLEHLFRGGGHPIDCLDAADADDDGRIAITDAIYTLLYKAIDPICHCLAIDPCAIPIFMWDGSRAGGFECNAPRVPSGAARSIALLLEGLRP